jgi:hypothetical protein
LNISPVALWSDDALRALIAWGKTFHHPLKPEVEWNVWQLALAAEALLAEQASRAARHFPSPTPTETSP